MNNDSDNGQSKETLLFEKARFEYCETIFEREKERKKNLENKAQIVLSLVTLMLAAIFLKVDILEALQQNMAEQSPLLQLGLGAVLSGLGLSLAATLYFVLRSVGLEKYQSEHPKYVVTSLFEPGSNYLPQHEAAEFYAATAMSYAIAVELNSETNDKKAVYVRYSWYAILSASAFLIAFLMIFVYLSLR